VAISGLIEQGHKVTSVDTTFKDFRTERDAYEGWLTSDDQMNMYVALAALHDPSQRQLENTTWGQVISGHAQATAMLRTLAARAVAPAVRSAAQSTLADVNAYYAFTLKMHVAVLAGHVPLGVRLVTVSNAPSSNKTQADFDSMGKALTAQAAAINSQAQSQAS